MSIDLDVVIDSQDYSVDMKSGLDTLQGASDARRYIAEAIVTGKITKRLDPESKVRTRLKKSFKGSYGQLFSVEFLDDELKEKFDDIGEDCFLELIRYFISESLYKDSGELSKHAEQVLNDLGDKSNELIAQLRVSCLARVHKVTNNFNLGVKLRHRKGRNDITELFSFDDETSQVLKSKKSNDVLQLMVSITRLNINTGNGRLFLEGEQESVAFGFDNPYKQVNYAWKKLLSKNLDGNNGKNSDGWEHLEIQANPVKMRSGKIVKYLIKGIL